MTRNQTLLAQSLVLLLCIAFSFYMAGKLPETVPTHWGISGKPDGYGPKALNLWLMPGVVLFNLVLTLSLPALSPKRFEIDRFAATFGTAMFLCTLMMAALHYVIIDATVAAVNSKPGSSFDIGKMMMVVLFLFFAALGNLMGRIKQNFFMGIRTPWTLADERVWDRTHREAGILWLVGGLLGAVISALGIPMVAGISLLLVIALTPVVRSFLIYKKLNPNGVPPTTTA
jgi:uncharacterized membrane protein